MKKTADEENKTRHITYSDCRSCPPRLDGTCSVSRLRVWGGVVVNKGVSAWWFMVLISSVWKRITGRGASERRSIGEEALNVRTLNLLHHKRWDRIDRYWWTDLNLSEELLHTRECDKKKISVSVRKIWKRDRWIVRVGTGFQWQDAVTMFVQKGHESDGNRQHSYSGQFQGTYCYPPQKNSFFCRRFLRTWSIVYFRIGRSHAWASLSNRPPAFLYAALS